MLAAVADLSSRSSQADGSSILIDQVKGRASAFVASDLLMIDQVNNIIRFLDGVEERRLKYYWHILKEAVKQSDETHPQGGDIIKDIPKMINDKFMERVLNLQQKRSTESYSPPISGVASPIVAFINVSADSVTMFVRFRCAGICNDIFTQAIDSFNDSNIGGMFIIYPYSEHLPDEKIEELKEAISNSSIRGFSE
ncbi:hypothetical protein A2526_01985 [candidate division WOR-1 bacterium RIFOXYD2_FULL_36_8]|nr:MAG: hypothetical protein A2526_01985 [candidate division WOR-1 bacterium RIFOXYD2_FULL_36_8]